MPSKERREYAEYLRWMREQLANPPEHIKRAIENKDPARERINEAFEQFVATLSPYNFRGGKFDECGDFNPPNEWGRAGSIANKQEARRRKQEVLRQFSHLPDNRNKASIIARQSGMPVRTVRRYLRGK